MCGRSVCRMNGGAIIRRCQYRNYRGETTLPKWKDSPGGQSYSPSYNIAPGAHTPVLYSEGSARTIQPMLWGLLPKWYKGPAGDFGFKMNNCRSESMMTTMSYKTPLARGQRCVILTDGFYEWKKEATGKQPYYIYMPVKDQLISTNLNTESKTESKDEVCSKSETAESGDAKINCDDSKTLEIPDKTVKTEFNDVSTKSETSGATNGVCRKSEISVETNDTDTKSETCTETTTNEVCVKSEICVATSDINDIKSEITEDTYRSFDDKTVIGVRELKSEIKQEADGLSEDTTVTGFGDDDDWMADVKLEDESQVDLTKDEYNGQQLLKMAGLYGVWTSPQGEVTYSYTVITVESSSTLSFLHHRMPAILLTDAEVDTWLNQDIPAQHAIKVIRPVTNISFHPVSTAVNNSRYNSPDCITKVDPKKPTPKPSAGANFMKNWLKIGSNSKVSDSKENNLGKNKDNVGQIKGNVGSKSGIKRKNDDEMENLNKHVKTELM